MEAADNSDQYLCLNKLQTGHAGEVDSDPAGWNEKCVGNWCWISATSSQFNIFTIKQPDKTYDIVSDSKMFHTCDQSTIGPSQFQLDITAENQKKANRFYCYQEGAYWSFAEWM